MSRKPKPGGRTAKQRQRAWIVHRHDAGFRQTSIWLSPVADAALERLAKVYGGRNKAIEAMILATDAVLNPGAQATSEPEPDSTDE